MARVLLIGGTCGGTRLAGVCGAPDPDPWWRPGSAFTEALRQHGHELAAPDDPYSWTGELDGVLDHAVWREAGHALYRWWQLHRDRVDAVIAFSHGGQVLTYGLVYGMALPAAIFVGTPVRPDLADRYRQARRALQRLTQLRSDWTDFWQLLGSLRLTELADSWRITRDLPGADVLVVPGVGHAGLLRVDVWERYGVWARLEVS